jgi:hypothetical protein
VGAARVPAGFGSAGARAPDRELAWEGGRDGGGASRSEGTRVASEGAGDAGTSRDAEGGPAGHAASFRRSSTPEGNGPEATGEGR